VPFVQHLFPGARLCPITVPPESSAHEFGRKLAAVLAPRRAEIVVIGSTDLTHYGPNYWFDPKGVGDQALEWVKTVNDRRIVDLAIELAGEQIVPRAQAEHSACGAGAMAATTAYCKAAGCPRGVLLHYTTSHDVMPERRPSSFVGYAGIVFPAPAA
jgi:AmmeMemoRadiSam system protein B